MCGIAGYYGFNDTVFLKKMLKTIKHRGPDDEGFIADENVAIGNRRLSIIDVRGGQQPIHNEDETVWITFNGEIYNYQEMRTQLLQVGHKFYTNSDTETIVHAYEEWGVDCVEKLNGMFAFAILDKKKKLLFLARDRFGIKPLYYTQQNKKFIFASEIKAILTDSSIQRVPKDDLIYQFLIYGIHDHTDDTFFEGIKNLLPAHYLIFDENGIKIKKYWDLKINENPNSSKTDKEVAQNLYALLEDSVKSHLISEVPVGTNLSGGIDSTAIVCLINKFLRQNKDLIKILGKKQKAFSAVYKEKEIDERDYIEDVIRHTNVEKNFAFPNSKILWKDLKKIVYHQDEPFFSPGIYAQWEVMKLASKKVKVVLDGQGGDEIFAGYIPYFGIYFADLWKKKQYFKLLKEFVLSSDLTFPFAKRLLRKSKEENEIKKFFNEEFVARFDQKIKTKWKGDNLSEFLYFEITKNSLPKLLRYEDKNSMAFSVESRVPFLDYRIVEFVFSLPPNQRIRNGWTKYVLRNALKGVIPERIRKRRSKIGFAVPEEKWIGDKGREYAEKYHDAIKNAKKLKKIYEE